MGASRAAGVMNTARRVRHDTHTPLLARARTARVALARSHLPPKSDLDLSRGATLGVTVLCGRPGNHGQHCASRGAHGGSLLLITRPIGQPAVAAFNEDTADLLAWRARLVTTRRAQIGSQCHPLIQRWSSCGGLRAQDAVPADGPARDCGAAHRWPRCGRAGASGARQAPHRACDGI